LRIRQAASVAAFIALIDPCCLPESPSLYSAGCGWWLVLICCERKVLLASWWLVLIWCERKILLLVANRTECWEALGCRDFEALGTEIYGGDDEGGGAAARVSRLLFVVVDTGGAGLDF